MKKIISCLILCFLFTSCNVNDSGILGLPWGIEYSKAKEIISKKGLEIDEEETNLSEDEIYQKYGLISSFTVYSVSSIDETSFFSTYKIIFHSNKFAGADISIGYISNEDEDDLSPEIIVNNIKADIIKKHGNPKEETENNIKCIKWEKNGIYIELYYFLYGVFNSYKLTYNNENYYNKKILTRYRTLEDTWISEGIPTKKDLISEENKVSDGFWAMSFDDYYLVYKIIINNGKIIFEKGNQSLLTPKKEKNNLDILSSEGPYPYTISNNKIIVTDESGNKKEYEYILNKNILKLVIDNKEITFTRFP